MNTGKQEKYLNKCYLREDGGWLYKHVYRTHPVAEPWEHHLTNIAQSFYDITFNEKAYMPCIHLVK